MSMSVGNMYNYFSSKEELAKFAIKYSTNILAVELKEIKPDLSGFFFFFKT